LSRSRSRNELGVSPVVMLSPKVWDELCEEQFELAHALADAATKVHIAMQNVESARNGNIDRKPYALALRKARIEARYAVAALNKYRKDHC
jgi:hypothetical protein